MPFTDEMAQVSISTAGEIIKTGTEKAMEILKALLKVILTRSGKSTAKKSVEEKLGQKNQKYLTHNAGEVDFKRFQNANQPYMMQNNLSMNDIESIVNKAESYNIPIAFIGKENNSQSVTAVFREQDKAVFEQILQETAQEKLAVKPDDYLTFKLNAGEAETISKMLTENDIPANFVKNADGDICCVYEAKNAEAMKLVKAEYKEIHQNVAKNTEFAAENGKIKITDSEQGKTITLSSLPDKEKLQRVLREQFGYDSNKALEAAHKHESTLSPQQRIYFNSYNPQAVLVNNFEKNIKLSDDNILTRPYSFTRANFVKDNTNRYLISNGDKSAVLVPSEMSKNKMEKAVRDKLGIDDSETVKALVDKAEKVESIVKTQERDIKQEKGDYKIERLTGNKFEVEQDGIVKRYDMRNKKEAVNMLKFDFGMSEEKAERIFGKAKKQNALQNEMRKSASERVKKPPIKNKIPVKGARK